MHIFHTKAFYATFFLLQFDFVIFWHKNIGTKAAHKILVKLIIGDFDKASNVDSSDLLTLTNATTYFDGSFNDSSSELFEGSEEGIFKLA